MTNFPVTSEHALEIAQRFLERRKLGIGPDLVHLDPQESRALSDAYVALTAAEAYAQRDIECHASVRCLQEVEIKALLTRRDELLATIRKLSAEVPYPEEQGNAAVLIAEVGTLRAQLAAVTTERDELKVECHGRRYDPNLVAETKRLTSQLARWRAWPRWSRRR